MPLSEHEKRMFAEIERQLVEDDPRFVARTRRTLRTWSPVVRLRAAVALGVLGVLGVLALTFDIIYGIVGMALVMVAIVLGAGAVADRSRFVDQGASPEGR
jgi:hypothetical protein